LDAGGTGLRSPEDVVALPMAGKQVMDLSCFPS
jgi:hypothetical protein